MELARFESGVNLFRNRVLARGRDVDLQLAGVKSLHRLALNESMPLTNWMPRQKFGAIVLDRPNGSPSTLHLKIRNETSSGMWSATTWLEQGRYIIEGRAKARGVAGALRNEAGGAGFRVWSDRKETRGASWSWFPYVETRDLQMGGLIPVVAGSVEQRLVGDADWKTITHEFELRQPLADLQIQCVLQGTAGEAWFDTSSITIRRVALNLSKGTGARE